ncbi:helix-hairpin-helix domain-containing protein [Endozoicomonas sp. SCSIO W0465]|uniref:ComEA family DNA-binding protein n=1 Tax=Endozoicomonas sp. SCSIO W0465 TaxID=2918516 RepID=UPI0020754AC0|nr:helix-hairpin-helix domain-containing protein [Endozoicomonas sp. SCSIO W0465]USE39442.1 helix-hairpin-helix domain-containing protein [Endozoicomonas sp. SCSIO W0465]
MIYNAFRKLLAKYCQALPQEDSSLIYEISSLQYEKSQGLLGVGPRIAMEIVKHRDQHGPYQSFDDLDKVKYVGSRMLEKNKKRIVFD